MKNRYNWAQVAQVYCKELGIDYPKMEEYLRAIYSDLLIEEYEKELANILETSNDNKSEYFPDLYMKSSIISRGTDKKIKKKVSWLQHNKFTKNN